MIKKPKLKLKKVYKKPDSNLKKVIEVWNKERHLHPNFLKWIDYREKELKELGLWN